MKWKCFSVSVLAPLMSSAGLAKFGFEFSLFKQMTVKKVENND